MTECLMDNMHRPGNDIRSINNIGSYNECKDKCIEDEECYTWTHMEGTCYLKNENTFMTEKKIKSSLLKSINIYRKCHKMITVKLSITE